MSGQGEGVGGGCTGEEEEGCKRERGGEGGGGEWAGGCIDCECGA